MKKKNTYRYSASLLIILVVATSWINNNQKPSLKNNYEEIKIGNQVWMTQNLNTITFRNGDTIPEAKTMEEWRKAARKRQPAWCYYNNDPANGATYGRLYNWFAASDPRGLAPKGWHVPLIAEWQTLFKTLGGKKPDAGQKMKSTTGWNNNRNGNNSSGFNGLPGGSRMTNFMIVKNEGFGGISDIGMWWSRNSFRKDDDIYCVVLYGKKNNAWSWWEDNGSGLSIRCVKD